jgi:hypothetical protein
MVTDNPTLDEKEEFESQEAGKNKEADACIPLFEGKVVILLDKSNGKSEILNRQPNQNFPKEEILRN